MIWDVVADCLTEQEFKPIAKDMNKMNFHIKIEEDTINICVLVKMYDEWYISLDELRKNVTEMERKFYFSGYKHINFMHIIFTENLKRDRAIAESELKCWIVDMLANRLIIFENQPEDYLNMREKLESALIDETKRGRIGLKDIPIVSIILIAINIIVFLMLDRVGDTQDGMFLLNHGAANWEKIYKSGEYYRLFTSMFLHFGPVHLMCNMFMLGVAGLYLEKIISRWNFLLTYIISGLVGSLCSSLYYMTQNTFAISAGASGAIFGLVGALAGIVIRDRRNTGVSVGFKIIFFMAIIAFDSMTSSGVDFMAHTAGIFSGVIMGFINYKPYCTRKNISKEKKHGK